MIYFKDEILLSRANLSLRFVQSVIAITKPGSEVKDCEPDPREPQASQLAEPH